MMSAPNQHHSNDPNAFPLLAPRLRELQGDLFNLGELMNRLEANASQVQRDNTIHRLDAIDLNDLLNWIEATEDIVKKANREGNRLIREASARAIHSVPLYRISRHRDGSANNNRDDVENRENTEEEDEISLGLLLLRMHNGEVDENGDSVGYEHSESNEGDSVHKEEFGKE